MKKAFRNHPDNMRIVFCLMILFIFGCKTSDRLSRENLSYYYDDSQNELVPEATIYHYSSDSSRCYFQIPFANLLTVNNGAAFIARVKVHYEIFPSYTAKSFIDSGTVAIEKQAVDSLSFIEGSFNFFLAMEKEAVVKLIFKDVNRKVEYMQLMNCKKNSAHDSQCYLLLDSMNHPVYQKFISAGSQFSVLSDVDNATKFTVRCYFHRYPFAIPPFKTSAEAIFDYAADSIFTITKNLIPSLKLQRHGFYFFQSDTAIKKGITLFEFGNEFPYVTKANELIEPTRYLTTQKEFDNLTTATNKKKAADEFWLSLAGDPDRARDAIKVYYGRTQEANRLFTSYTEGWKTDRGMIYIIFGSPRSVYRDDVSETWSYFTNPGTPELIFTFKKMGNPFTDNDYSLIRDPSYESIWFLAVEQWRQGRVVNNND